MSARSPDRVVLVSVALEGMAHRELEALKDYARHEHIAPTSAGTVSNATAAAAAPALPDQKGKGKGGVRLQSLQNNGLVQVFGRQVQIYMCTIRLPQCSRV